MEGGFSCLSLFACMVLLVKTLRTRCKTKLAVESKKEKAEEETTRLFSSSTRLNSSGRKFVSRSGWVRCSRPLRFYVICSAGVRRMVRFFFVPFFYSVYLGRRSSLLLYE